MTDMLQKSENVAKNVANENSQDLTKQWKKGELPEGWYWVEYSVDEINGVAMMKYMPEFGGFSFTIIKQVLAPVPSYDEYMTMKDCVRKEFEAVEKYAELKETNEALKSELKEVCDVLIRKCPEMKEWVMMNWKHLYEVKDE